MLYMIIYYEKGVAMVKWFSHQLSNQEVSGLNLAIANFILELDSSAFFIRPPPELLPVLGPLEQYMMPTLDMALL